MSPRTVANNARIREEQKKHILAAAKSVFAHKGYSDTKMTDIAVAAQVSYGLIYHYFKDKDEIFVKVIEEALDISITLMHRARELPGTPWEHLHWLTTHMLHGAQLQPESFMVILQAFANDAVPREAREIAWKSSLVSLETITQMIIEGQKAGQVVAGDANHLASVFGWCLQGMALGVGFLNRRLDTTPQLLTTSFPDADDILRILKG